MHVHLAKNTSHVEKLCLKLAMETHLLWLGYYWLIQNKTNNCDDFVQVGNLGFFVLYCMSIEF
jgi:hypothetical protein